MNFSFSLLEVFQALSIGLLTGLLSGTFGVGGGIVCTPMLRLIMHLDAHMAIGTTLALIVPTSVAGAINYVKEKLVDLNMVKLLVLPAIIGTLIGAELTMQVQGRTLMLLFAALITLAAIDLLSGFSNKLKQKAAAKVELDQTKVLHAVLDPAEVVPKKLGWFNVFPVGLLTGLLAGFFGVGGGFILIPILLAVYGMSAKSAFGTSLLVVACLSLPGTIAHSINHHVQFLLVLVMVLGAVPGSMIGSKLALRLKDSLLKRAFGAIMLAMAAFMVYKEL
ncbi:MAG: sulfite exporter TauE/SafE family protein [Candidatus Obscuribacterales bacterium]